jgi:anti-sigma B factor antagonist
MSAEQPVEGGDAVVSMDDGVTVIHLSGEVDTVLEPRLRFISQDAIDRGLPVRVDLSAVTFMDSSGLGFLAALAAAGRARGYTLSVVGAGPLVRETIELTGLLPVLDLID